MERSSHPSRAQIDALIEFLEQNQSPAKGFSKVPSAKDAARRKWEQLSVKLNSMGGSIKTWKQWTKVCFKYIMMHGSVLDLVAKYTHRAEKICCLKLSHFNTKIIYPLL